MAFDTYFICTRELFKAIGFKHVNDNIYAANICTTGDLCIVEITDLINKDEIGFKTSKQCAKWLSDAPYDLKKVSVDEFCHKRRVCRLPFLWTEPDDLIMLIHLKALQSHDLFIRKIDFIENEIFLTETASIEIIFLPDHHMGAWLTGDVRDFMNIFGIGELDEEEITKLEKLENKITEESNCVPADKALEKFKQFMETENEENLYNTSNGPDSGC